MHWKKKHWKNRCSAVIFSTKRRRFSTRYFYCKILPQEIVILFFFDRKTPVLLKIALKILKLQKFTIFGQNWSWFFGCMHILDIFVGSWKTFRWRLLFWRFVCYFREDGIFGIFFIPSLKIIFCRGGNISQGILKPELFRWEVLRWNMI
jgi:hypothetical protein